MDKITIALADGKLKYTPMDLTDDPIDVDETQLVNISDTEGVQSQEAQERLVSAAKELASNSGQDVDEPDSFDDLEFLNTPMSLFRPYEPVDVKNESGRRRWIDEKYFEGKVNFRGVDPSVPLAYFDALRSYRDGNYYAASVSGMAAIEKLMCEAADQKHRSTALEWMRNNSAFRHADADQIDRLYEIYNSNKHRRRRLTEVRDGKEPEIRTQEYLEKNTLERRTVEQPDEENKRVTDQPSHYKAFEIECEQILEQLFAVVRDSPHTSVSGERSQPFKRRSLVLSQ